VFWATLEDKEFPREQGAMVEPQGHVAFASLPRLLICFFLIFWRQARVPLMGR
jgi:hypothetical protein